MTSLLTLITRVRLILLGAVLLGGGLLGAGPLHAQVVDFEDGSIPDDWTEPNGSDASWAVTTATAGSGSYSLGSGSIADGETSEIEVTVEVPVDSSISFDYRVSSEAHYDYFRFYVDGSQRLERSGESGWVASGPINVSAGTHTFRWTYEKDDICCTSNSDRAWIDNVSLPTTPSEIVVNASENGGTASVTQSTWNGAPENMIDGDPSTEWQVSGNPDDIIAIFELADTAQVTKDSIDIGGTGGGRSVSEYEIYTRYQSSDPWTLATTVDASVNEDDDGGTEEHTFADTLEGTQFRLVITQHTAPSGCGFSCDVPIAEYQLIGEFGTSTVGDTTAPAPSSRLTAVASPDRISLMWSASDSSDVENYRVYRETQPIDSTAGPSDYAVYDSTAADDTTFTDTNVTTGTTYYYRVTTVDTAGNESGFSPEAGGIPQERTIHYVDADATGANDGSSWGDAYVHLQDALDVATRDSAITHEVWLAEGTYYPDQDAVDHDGDGESEHVEGDRNESFTVLHDNVELYGGFSGSETSRDQRDPSINESVLSGDIGLGSDSSDNSYQVVYLDGTSSENITGATVLDGVIVEKGTARGNFPNDIGGGLFCNAGGSGNVCAPLLEDVTFRDNAASFGGAVFNNGTDLDPKTTTTAEREDVQHVNTPVSHLQRPKRRTVGVREKASTPGGASPEFRSVTFTGNEADASGGAMYNWGDNGESSPSITETTFTGNVAGSSGGAVFNDGSPGTASPVVEHVTFRQNEATLGGAFYNLASYGGTASPVFQKSDFERNEADFGGALQIASDSTDAMGTPSEARPMFFGVHFSQNVATGAVDDSGNPISDGGALRTLAVDGALAEPIVVNTIFSGNAAARDGGAVYNVGATNESGGEAVPTFVNTTFVGNTADKNGGAISNFGEEGGSASPLLANVILWNNQGNADGDDVGADQEMFSTNASAQPSIRYSIVEGGSEAVADAGGASTTYDSASILDQNPQFVGENEGAGSDGAYGSDDDDLRLEGPGSSGGGSPAIDAGDNTALDLNGDGHLDISEDRGGEDRRLDVEDVSDTGNGSSPIVDIGAYESDGSLSGGGAVVPPAPSDLVVTEAQTGVEVAWTEVDGMNPQHYRVYRDAQPIDSTAGPSTYSHLQEVAASETSYSDPTPPTGTTSYYRVTVVDENGNESGFSEMAVRYLEEMTANVRNVFGDPTEEENFELVALPGDASVSLNTALAGSSPEDWRAFDWNGSFDEASGANTFGPGEGYWVLARDAFSVDRDVEPVQLTEGGTYRLSLRSGWNLISNPFDQDLSWPRVQQANDMDAALWRWNGRWSETQTFTSAQEGEAFYVRNRNGASTLELPYPGLSELGMEQATEKEADAPDRRLRLSAREEGETRAVLHLAWSKTAHRGLDTLDRFAPPDRFQPVSLQSQADSIEAPLAADVRPPKSERGHRYTLDLKAPAGEPLTLRADNLETIDDREVVLVRRATAETYDLHQTHQVEVTPSANSTCWVLLVGSSDYVEQAKQDLVPETIQLHGNYPNPVRHDTTIEYGLPEEQHVRLTIYDVLGRRVQVLVDEQQSAGVHTVQWGRRSGGRYVASGVYFYRLQAGSQVLTRKITVVR